MVDVDLIKRKLLLLEDKKRELGAFPTKDLAAFKEDVLLQKAVEKILEEIVQICIDIGKHIIADEQMNLPDSNVGIFDVLTANNVVTESTAALMRKMVGFRNVLVHMYEKIDVDSVYVSYKNRMGDFDLYSQEIAAYLAKKLGIHGGRREGDKGN